MKKIISMILSLSMILAIAATMGISVAAAPEGTAIKSAADFAAMAADGKYYLANDITIEATYMNQFLGTIDGNGKTVTVKAPMFHTFGGSIKNLKIKGEVTTAYGSTQSSDTNPTIYNWGDIGIGAIAAFVVAPEGTTVLFDNIVSDATVSCDHKETTYTNKEGVATADRAAAGALYGIGMGANITVTNCTNNGTITGMDQVGGLVGWADRAKTTTFTMTNCVNNGVVNATNNYGGALVGRGSEGATIVSDCVNNGTMKCYNSQAGGIVGYIESSISVSFKNCLNAGPVVDIDMTDDKQINFGGILGAMAAKADGVSISFEKCTNIVDFNYDAQTSKYAGGICARITVSGLKNLTLVLKDCVNTGSFSNVGHSGGIVAIYESKTAVSDSTLLVSNCVNTGKISSNANVGGIIGRAGTDKAFAIVTYERCSNYGDLSGKQVGGIASYQYGSKEISYAIVNGCANFGTLTSTGWVAQILTYGNNNNIKVTNNLAAGKVVGDIDNQAVIIGLSNADITKYTVSGNYYIENDGTKTYSYATNDDNAANRVALADMPANAIITCTEAQLADGTVAKALNAAIGSEVFKVEDGKTVIPCNHEYTFVDGKCPACGYSEPALPDNPVSGDNAWVYMTVAVIAILGTAVVLKKREN